MTTRCFLRPVLAAAWLILACGAGVSQARAADLFEGHSTLAVTLRGPVSALTRGKAHRDERDFTLVTEGHELPVRVRLRGHSRVKLCRFPPLRLDFSGDAVRGTPFEGLDKVKLVTHCKDGDRARDTLHNEYLAYRIFNHLSEAGYRVRLLEVIYEESEGRHAGQAERHPAFLIEPQDRLAQRLGGSEVEIASVRYSQLDPRQLARVSVFEHLIGNADWAMGQAEGQDECCHNIDLVGTDGGWQAVPYDFDLSVLADARYTGPFAVRQAGARTYLGYCLLPGDLVQGAVREALGRREEILALARSIPAADEGRRDRRLRFLEAFFERGEESLLEEFARDCRGRR